MLNNEELIKLENKYFELLKNTLSANLGKIISQICSQKLFVDLAENEKTNVIDTAVENIVESIISRNLDWNPCSMPIRADSCYECGDAIVHIDAKTVKITDQDAKQNKINVEKAQTSYDYKKERVISKKAWKPNLKYYENHDFYGNIPNLTYFVRMVYSEENLVESISLISIPNGQLFSLFGNNIMAAGKDLEKGKKNKEETIRKNIRFLINNIIKCDGQSWRSELLFERKNKNR